MVYEDNNEKITLLKHPSRNLDAGLHGSSNNNSSTDSELDSKKKSKNASGSQSRPKPAKAASLSQSRIKSAMDSSRQRKKPFKRISRSGSESLISKTSDIQEIKSSLKGHFDAIKSLQDALSIGARRPPGGSTLGLAGLAGLGDTLPLAQAAAQTSNDIRDRIKKIESTLRDVGENVSASEASISLPPSVSGLMSVPSRPPTAPPSQSPPKLSFGKDFKYAYTGDVPNNQGMGRNYSKEPTTYNEPEPRYVKENTHNQSESRYSQAEPNYAKQDMYNQSEPNNKYNYNEQKPNQYHSEKPPSRSMNYDQQPSRPMSYDQQPSAPTVLIKELDLAKQGAEVGKVSQRLDKMENFMSDISQGLRDMKQRQELVTSASLAAAASAPSSQKLNPQLTDQLSKLLSEVHRLRFDFRAQEKKNQELVDKNQSLEKKIELLANAMAEPPPLDPQVQTYCKKVIQKELGYLEKSMAEKVDTAVLEELARHIATKEDLKKYVKKTSMNKIISDNAGIFIPANISLATPAPQSGPSLGGKLHNIDHTYSQNVQASQPLPPPSHEFVQLKESIHKLRSKVHKLNDEVRRMEGRLPVLNSEKQNELFIQGQIYDIETKMERKMQDWILDRIHARVEESETLHEMRLGLAKNEIEIGVKAMISDVVRKSIEENPHNMNAEDADSNPLIRKLVRDFDEKLYTVCSDLSSCKQLFVSQSTQPFYRCAQWLWTSASLKLGSAVPWNIQTANTGTFSFFIF